MIELKELTLGYGQRTLFPTACAVHILMSVL